VFKRLARLVVVSGFAVGLSPLTASAAAATTFYLDSYNAVDASHAFCSGANLLPTVTPPGCGNSITAPVVLGTESSYTVTVVGAVSAWGAWPHRHCGKPAPSSQFASPGIANKPAGDDSQFRFASPLYLGKCPKLPQKTSFFQVDLGNGWFHPVANGNQPSHDNDKASDQHRNTFTFTGQGVEPQFRFIDYHSSDNSGRFKIVVSG
jgi:hypothetical protein